MVYAFTYKHPNYLCGAESISCLFHAYYRPHPSCPPRSWLETFKSIAMTSQERGNRVSTRMWRVLQKAWRQQQTLGSFRTYFTKQIQTYWRRILRVAHLILCVQTPTTKNRSTQYCMPILDNFNGKYHRQRGFLVSTYIIPACFLRIFGI
jgi:hypothetical protein